MADEGFVKILQQGTIKWNSWRREHPEVIKPNLAGADLADAYLAGSDLSGAGLGAAKLSGANLGLANLSRAFLSHANLIRANLAGANLSRAYLADANLSGANLTDADLSDANLRGAILSRANLGLTNLSGADLSGANLPSTNFTGTDLSGTRFHGSYVRQTVFADVDLRGASGLTAIIHRGPSEVSISTLYKSEGDIPEDFLLGCGVPEDFITYMRSLAGKAIEFHSCFISYSTHDQEFAKRLHARMREAGLRVWFAPEDMKGGDYLRDQIDRAIQYNDRLLVVLSESSMRSEWVTTEILRAWKVEKKEGRRKLFPIRVADFETIKGWECFDPDEGADLAREVRRFYIPDFSNWKAHDDFEREFARLYESLKAAS